jgi:hypothetical protein
MTTAGQLSTYNGVAVTTHVAIEAEHGDGEFEPRRRGDIYRNKVNTTPAALEGGTYELDLKTDLSEKRDTTSV